MSLLKMTSESVESATKDARAVTDPLTKSAIYALVQATEKKAPNVFLVQIIVISVLRQDVASAARATS